MCQLSCSDLTQKVRVDIVYFSFINILMRSPGSGQLRFLGLSSIKFESVYCKASAPKSGQMPLIIKGLIQGRAVIHRPESAANPTFYRS